MSGRSAPGVETSSRYRPLTTSSMSRRNASERLSRARSSAPAPASDSAKTATTRLPSNPRTSTSTTNRPASAAASSASARTRSASGSLAGRAPGRSGESGGRASVGTVGGDGKRPFGGTGACRAAGRGWDPACRQTRRVAGALAAAGRPGAPVSRRSLRPRAEARGSALKVRRAPPGRNRVNLPWGPQIRPACAECVGPPAGAARTAARPLPPSGRSPRPHAHRPAASARARTVPLTREGGSFSPPSAAVGEKRGERTGHWRRAPPAAASGPGRQAATASR